jgi:hypothetical protein
MQADFDDIRFTRNDGTTLIDAWLESKVDSTSAKTWAEFPTTPANTITQTYYMYYGKAVANYWDGDATFIFHDAFTTDKWTDDTNLYVDTVNTRIYYKLYRDATEVKISVSSNVGTSNWMLEFDEKLIAASGAYSWLFGPAYSENAENVRSAISNSRDQTGFFRRSGYGGDYRVLDGSYGSSISSGPVDNTQYHIHIYRSGNTLYHQIYDNSNHDNLLWSSSYSYAGTASLSYLVIGNDHDNAGATSYVEGYILPNLFVRKYAANPPTYAFGAEESPAGGVAPTSVFSGPFVGPFGGPI